MARGGDKKTINHPSMFDVSKLEIEREPSISNIEHLECITFTLRFYCYFDYEFPTLLWFLPWRIANLIESGFTECGIAKAEKILDRSLKTNENGQ